MMNEQDIDQVLKNVVINSMSDPIPATSQNIKILPKVEGHYVIMCDKPAPYGVALPTTKDGLHIIYDGSAKDLRRRLQTHLLGSAESRWNSGSGLAWNSMSETKFQSLIASGDIDEYYAVYHKKGSDKDGNELRYLNGINIDSEQFRDHKFYVSYTETENYGNALERVFRKTFGQPPLCRTLTR